MDYDDFSMFSQYLIFNSNLCLPLRVESNEARTLLRIAVDFVEWLQMFILPHLSQLGMNHPNLPSIFQPSFKSICAFFALHPPPNKFENPCIHRNISST
jgi:hypothetical protein